MSKLLLALILLIAVAVPSGARASDIDVTGDVALTTGSLSVAYNSYSEFYVAANTTVTIRALSDETTTTTLCYVKYFATDPSSSVLDASTRELTGIALQEGDVLTITISTAGWIGIDGAVGTSKVFAAGAR